MIKMKGCFIVFLSSVFLGFTWFGGGEDGAEQDQPSASQARPGPASPGTSPRAPEPGRDPDPAGGAGAGVNLPALNAAQRAQAATASLRDIPAGYRSQQPPSGGGPGISGMAGIQRTIAAQQGGGASLSTGRMQAPSAIGPEDIARLQRQINEIIQANVHFESHQHAQMEQIKQITEQARIHRNMLRSIENKRAEMEDLTPGDLDQVLQHEKLLLIKNETEKNRELIDTLTRGGDED